MPLCAMLTTGARLARCGKVEIMTQLLDKHIELVESVNNSRTIAEHESAKQRLRGFRDALDHMEPRPMHLVKCDHHYLDQGIDRPMCCGVWLDWVPNDEVKPRQYGA